MVLAHRAASLLVYKLEGLEGTFNEPELQLAAPAAPAAVEPTALERVLKRFGKGKAMRYLVKWRSLPEYMSEWLSTDRQQLPRPQ